VLDSTRLQARNRSREIEADGEVHIRHAGDIRRLPPTDKSTSSTVGTTGRGGQAVL
jgi:hypothetical protein